MTLLAKKGSPSCSKIVEHGTSYRMHKMASRNPLILLWRKNQSYVMSNKVCSKTPIFKMEHNLKSWNTT